MNSPLNTYILRLADVYLTYAEACLGNSEELTGGPGLEALNQVRECTYPPQGTRNLRRHHSRTPRRVLDGVL